MIEKIKEVYPSTLDVNLKKVEITFLPGSDGYYRVEDNSLFSPHLDMIKLTAAILELGVVQSFRSTADQTKYGTKSLDVQVKMSESNKSENQDISVQLLYNFNGRVKLIRLNGRNVVFLTTEKEKSKRLGLTTKQIDDARKWLAEQGIEIKNEAIISQFHLKGLNIYTETMGFVIDDKED